MPEMPSPDSELDGVVKAVLSASPTLHTTDAITEVTRRITQHPGWTALDDPNPRCAKPAFLLYKGGTLHSSSSRSWLREMIAEARTATPAG